MSMLLDIGLFGLGGLLVLEFMIYTALLSETATWVRSRRGQAPAVASQNSKYQVTRLRVGQRVPRFRGQPLDGGGVFTRRDLSQMASALLFVTTENISDMSPSARDAMVHALSHKVSGRLYVIFGGSRDDGLRFKHQHLLPRNHCEQAQLIVDEHRAVTNSFAIVSALPAALLVNEKGYITKIGSKSPE